MRIAGVQKGKNRGDVIELAPEKKALEAVKLGAATAPQYKDFLVSVTDVTVRNLQVSPKGDKLKKLWVNNRYMAAGTAKIWFRDPAKHQVHDPKVWEWEAVFVDVLDTWGMPDIEIESFKTV